MVDHWADWEDVLPWDQLESETDRAYAAFCVYRDAGPKRSLRKASGAFYSDTDRIGTTTELRQFAAWSSEHEWVARAHAWDSYEEAQRRIAHADELRDMGKRHANIAANLQIKALERLDLLDVGALGARDVLVYLVESVKLERLARGASTEHVEIESVASAIPTPLRELPVDTARMAEIIAALEEAGIGVGIESERFNADESSEPD